MAADHTTTRRVIELMGDYGTAKFGGEWEPSEASNYIGRKKGGRLEQIVEDETLVVDCDEAVKLLNAYGDAKFGDEWWPGNSACHLDDDRELEIRLESDDYSYLDPAPQTAATPAP